MRPRVSSANQHVDEDERVQLKIYIAEDERVVFKKIIVTCGHEQGKRICIQFMQGFGIQVQFACLHSSTRLLA